MREGLRGAAAYQLFDGYCQRLVIDGVPLWRAHAAMETLHPQWSGYGYTWRRDLNAIQPEQYAHSDRNDRHLAEEPFYDLIRSAPRRRGQSRRCAGASKTARSSAIFRCSRSFSPPAAPIISRQLFEFGEDGDRSQGTGIVYSFTTDRTGGFTDDDMTLLQATLPALSLAMKAHAGHVIASGLLGTYLGEDAGRRVHAGADRARLGRAICAPCSGTPTSAASRRSTDAAPGAVVIDLLNDVFEILTAALRDRAAARC